MKPTNSFRVNAGFAAAALGLCLTAGLLLSSGAPRVAAQDTQAIQADGGGAAAPVQPVPARGRRGRAGGPAGATSSIATEVSATAATNAVAAPGTNTDGQAKAEPDKGGAADGFALSFQNSPLDMVMQWMMEHTGKTVMKSSSVNAQITVMNSKKVSLREALNMIYRALSLEGYSAVETADSIIIVREGSEPKMNIEILDSTNNVIPEGRQRLMKRFPLKSAQAADIRERVRPVLSDKGAIDIDERSNQLIVTDYNDNLRLLNDLVMQLDVPSISDIAIEIVPLKHGESDDLATLLTMIINAQAPPMNLNANASGSSPSPNLNMSVTGPRGGIRIVNGVPQPMPGNSPSMDSTPSPGGSAGPSPASAAQVHIWSDKISNRLIVSAPKAKMPEIKRLIDDLDSDKPQDVAVRTIPLKNLTATIFVNEIRTLYQKLSGKSLKDIIEVSANDRSNSLIVLSSESNYHALQKLIDALDTESAQEKVTRTFPLKNADAEDVATQLQDLNSDQSGSSARYVYNLYPTSPKKMTVVADRRRNSLIIQAPPAQMPEISKMVEELDAAVADDALAPMIYHLKFAAASDIEDVLNELFLKKADTRSYIDVIYGVGDPASSGANVGRLYGKVRITSEPYSNTLIISSNSKENLDAVLEVVKELDQEPQDGETTVRVPLSFAKASTLANSLNILFAKGGAPPLQQPNQPGQQNGNANNNPNNGNNSNPQQTGSVSSGFDLQADTKENGYYPWIGGQPENTRSSDGRSAVLPVSDLVGRVRVVPDDRINALLISANAHFLTQVIKLVEQLDTSVPSVMIEARIVEVSTDYLDQLGVRWSPDGSTFTAADRDNSFIASSGASYTKGFGGNTTASTPAGVTAGTIASTIASLRSGVVDNSISMEFLVQFLHENTHATVMAAPQIHIENNQMGQLFVGKQVPIQTASQNSGSIGLTSQFQYKNVGVILEVTPHINRTGDISLKIHAESSTVEPGVQVLGSDVFDTRYFKTDLTAKSGQTLVLAGIIQKQLSDTIRKTPILGSIPGLGWAFKKKDQSVQNVELIVFLRPKVVASTEDNEELLQDVGKHAPLVNKWINDNSNTDDTQSKTKRK